MTDRAKRKKQQRWPFWAKPSPEGGPHTAFNAKTRVLVEPGAAPSPEQREVLLAMHAEVSASWRDLHEVRFRLLGLLPLVTLGVFSVAPRAEGDLWSASVVVVVAALGWSVTHGLWIYDYRNDELYDDLISRGRRIEAELGIEHGVFRGRPDARWQGIDHTTGTLLIYRSVYLAWIAGFVLAVMHFLHLLGAGGPPALAP